ncbi:hypothetical protein B0F90DRAFT_1763836 [Multifurca ochricompacta]|uniref:Uncharacterized protein n=1 Tax=Multifurca ochricompacta TaxID=376703 RepID=A0AAD4QJZ9_9AGAM|nr:hypothetical protein B0F90DRAFT_1763836 [Multifurca ochricompacta]
MYRGLGFNAQHGHTFPVTEVPQLGPCCHIHCLGSSLYGPINKIINLQLPPDHMVKPQGLIQDSDGHSDDRDSYGTFNRDSTKAYQDFIIYKFSADHHQDIIKAIIEVKGPDNIESAIVQTYDYMDKAGAQDAIGIAISGNNIRVLDLDGS